MSKLMSGWTEQHALVALALVVAVLGGAVAAVEPGPHSLVGVGAVVATALGALFFDAFGGLVVGLLAAAAVVGSRQLADRWTAESFAVALTLVVTLVTLGWLVGMVGAGIHRRRGRGDGGEGAASPAYGSLGLLTPEVAAVRLEEEVARARRHHRPLTAVVIRVSVTEQTLDPATRGAAQRAVARLVETLLRDTDVPFALGPGELGAILPETDATTAWDVVGDVLDAATKAAFTVREQDERRALVDCAELHAGLASLSDDLAEPGPLLEAARRAAGADELQSSRAHAAPEEAA
ncbi:hypothetical protein [Modestobacter sp. URMC 112]